MKTTVILDDAVFRQAKQHAALRGTTLSAVIDQSLRAHLRAEATRVLPARPFVIPVYGQRAARGSGVSVDQLAALRDEGR